MAGLQGLPRLLTEAEAAEYLGVTELTLYRWRKRGLIACIMVGKSPRYTEQHILDYLASRETPIATPVEPKPQPSPRGQKRTGSESNPLMLAHQILKARRDGH